jgi:hypothetical protein
VEKAGDPDALRGAINHAVLEYLGSRSAHGDVASALADAVAPLGDVQAYCPDWARFRYVVVATRGVVFGFAVDMDSVGFRLGPEFKARALTCGAVGFPPAGPDWVLIKVFRSDWPDPDLTFWARKAYVHARQLSGL